MPLVDHPPSEPTLYTCQFEDRFGALHPCAKAHRALAQSGVTYRSEIFATGRPRGIGTKGRRPDLARISGQEKLPVLALPDGTTVNGSHDIVTWAAGHHVA
jgi:glutathione S-transferase